MNLAKYQGLQYQASMGLVAPRCMNKQTQVAGFSRHVHGWIVQIVGMVQSVSLQWASIFTFVVGKLHTGC